MWYSNDMFHYMFKAEIVMSGYEVYYFHAHVCFFVFSCTTDRLYRYDVELDSWETVGRISPTSAV